MHSTTLFATCSPFFILPSTFGFYNCSYPIQTATVTLVSRKSSLFRFNAFTGHSVPDALQNNLGAFKKKKKKKTVPNNNFYFKVYNTYTKTIFLLLLLLEGKKTRQKIFTREREMNGVVRNSSMEKSTSGRREKLKNRVRVCLVSGYYVAATTILP